MPILLLLAVLALLVPTRLEARQPSIFVPSASGLRVGSDVYVVVDAPCTTDGCAGEWVRGRVTSLTASTLSVDDGQSRHQLAAADIQLVSRPGDSLWNGIGKGAVFGFVGGYVFPFVAFSSECRNGCIIPVGVAAVAYGTIGAAIGAVIGLIADARTEGLRKVWERPRHVSSRASIVPLVGERAAGVQVNVRF